MSKTQIDLPYIPIKRPYNIKESLLDIKARYIQLPLTKETLCKMDLELMALFEFYNLKDLQYTILHNKENCSVEIKPIRQIDAWALTGILGT